MSGINEMNHTPQQTMRLRRRWRLLFLACMSVLCISFALYLTVVPNGRIHAKSMLLVFDLLLSPKKTLLPQATTGISKELISISTVDGEVEAQYYQPMDEKSHGALILVLGYPSNIGDSQLNRLAENLARLEIAILIPRLPGLSAGKLEANDVNVLVNAFQWLAEQPKISPNHIGFSGFCVGSSLALLAAEDPRINDEVALVNVFGGYYDLQTFMRATAVHSAFYNGKEHPWHPSEQTVSLYAQNVLGYLENDNDRTILKRYFTDGASELEQLTTGGKIAYGLLTTTNAHDMDALLAQMPSSYQTKIANVSPSTKIEQLHAKIFIMHDVSDPYVPVVESYRLAEGISDPDQRVQADFVLFKHVRPDTTQERITVLREGIRLIFYLVPLLQELEPDQ